MGAIQLGERSNDDHVKNAPESNSKHLTSSCIIFLRHPILTASDFTPIPVTDKSETKVK